MKKKKNIREMDIILDNLAGINRAYIMDDECF